MIPNTSLSVQAILQLGLDVCLPELLDTWFALTAHDGIREDIAFSIMTTDVATTHDISHRHAHDVVQFTLTKMGIPFFTEIEASA
tara:strand:- start:316 stop:570 length:255 start_codon:yes stop_codon:yes gene_type:complete